MNAEHATYDMIENRPTLRFARRLSHPVDLVWRAITDPAELAQWFPTEVAGDLRVGGRMTFTFEQHTLPDGSNTMSGEVTDLDPPRLLAFHWGEDHLRFELDPVGREQCDLRLTVQLGTRDKAARDAAGWHVCLDRLARLVGGAAGPAVTGAGAQWRELYESYQRLGAPTGAEIPVS